MMKKLISIILISISLSTVGQDNKFENWTEMEIAQYSKLMALSKYVHNKKKSEISKDTLFEKYIYFDNVLSDTDIERKEMRLAAFDTIFYSFRKTIDSIGLENLEAKPLKFYREYEIYEPFKKQLSEYEPIVLVYFKKNKPDTPLGTLLFEEKSHKLLAWILIDQGGYYYYLTFNLL